MKNKPKHLTNSLLCSIRDAIYFCAMVLGGLFAILTMVVVLACSKAHSTELNVVNRSGAEIRITHIRNKCGGDFVDKEAPVYLQNKETFVIKQTDPVIHTFQVCGSGQCVQSAIGMKKSVAKYVLEIVIKNRLLDGRGIPDHWTDTDMECNSTNTDNLSPWHSLKLTRGF